jgi:hypothetical protein
MKRTVVTVVAACTVPIATIFLLVRHPPASDVLMVALCLGSIVVSIVAAVWILSDRSPRASAAEPQSPWLDVSADADSVTVVGDASGLEALGAECLRVARAASPAKARSSRRTAPAPSRLNGRSRNRPGP